MAEVAPSTQAMEQSFVEAVPQDVNTFNPLLAPNPTARSAIEKILPRLVALDPASGEVAPTELATGWAWSADGRSLTMTLRSGVRWSDGAPLTSQDVVFTLNAMATRGELSGIDPALIESTTAPEPYLVALRLREPHCALLQALALPILPSHLFTDTTTLDSHPWNQAPTVGAGPFLFVARAPGEGIMLRRNQNYWKGAPQISDYRLTIEPDADQRLSSIDSGAADLALDVGGDLPPLRRPNLAFALRRLDGYSLLALNMADPANPQPGKGPTGALIAQSPHPILGDVRVRRAIAAALDTESLLREFYGAGSGALASWVLPSVTWAYDDALRPYGHNLDGAALLLEEAGWSLPAGETIRRKDGQPLQVSLVTNADNPQRVNLANRIADSLRSIGFEVRADALSFDDASKLILGQRYDLAILGWEELGSDPASLDFFSIAGDVPDSGMNVTSYQNPSVDRLLEEARTLPGCSYTDRGQRYREAQRRIYEDAPVIMLKELATFDAWDPQWQGLAPAPWAVYQGVERWSALDAESDRGN